MESSTGCAEFQQLLDLLGHAQVLHSNHHGISAHSLTPLLGVENISLIFICINNPDGVF
jgi:hypothetical protein